MKKNCVIRYLTCLVAVMLLVALGASAEENLSVDFRGLSLTEGNNWRSVALNAVFDVMDASGNDLGALAAYATQEQRQSGLQDSLQIPAGTQNVLLVPRVDTLPQGYQVENQYEINLAEAGPRVSLFVYKAEGLFSLTNLYPDGTPVLGAAFELLDSQGKTVTAFITDEQGWYTLGEAVPAGTYCLRQTQFPAEALPAADQTITIPTYRGAAILQIQWINEPAPLDQMGLGSLTAERNDSRISLYEKENEIHWIIEDGMKGRNEWPLTDYQIELKDLALTDGENQTLNVEQEVYLSELSYQPGTEGYGLQVKLKNAKGEWLGDPVYLQAGETLTNRNPQVVGAVITYQNTRTGEAVVAPGFDGGRLSVKLHAAQRMPKADSPDAAAVVLTVENQYKLVYQANEQSGVLESQPAKIIARQPVDESFAVSADLWVNDQGIGALTLANAGLRTLPAAWATVRLPDGWRMDAVTEGQILRMTDGDYWILKTQALAPGEECVYEMPLSAYEDQGEGRLYWNHTGAFVPALNTPAVRETNESGVAFTAMAEGRRTAEMLAPVSGCLFEDLNGNGLKDNNEAGQAGLRVEWSDDHLTYAAVTDDQGRFTLMAAPAQSASLTVQLPEHMVLGTVLNSLEIPYTVTGRVAGQVLCGEAPMAGITVQLGEWTTVTDAQGAYAFNQLVDGEYQLIFTLPEKMQADYGFVGGSLATWQTTVTLGNGIKEVVADALTEHLGAVLVEAEGLDGAEAVLFREDKEVARAPFVSGFAMFMQVYPDDYRMQVELPAGMMLADLNGYATTQKETAVWNLGVEGGQRASYRMTLAPLARLELSGADLAVTLTDGQGMVIAPAQKGVYENLLPGEYTLNCTMPEGYLPTSDAWTLKEGVLSRQVTLAVGQQAAVALDAVKTGSIEGFLFEDGNGNGLKDDKEKGIKNVTVTLMNQANVAATAVTDGDGKYVFENLLPGEYKLTMPVQKNYAFRQEANGVIGTDGTSELIVLAEGACLTHQNGVLVAPASLKAAVFLDSNENGERGVYERAVEGAAVTLLNAQGEAVAQGTTNSVGEWKLNGLAPGMYRLQFEIPDGYAFGPKGAHENSQSSATDTLDSQTAVTEPFELFQGKVRNIGCGIVRLGSVTGKVWYDVDANGVMGEDEPGQAGVRIILTPRRPGGQTYELVTDETGVFLFDRVRSASYTLTAELPDGMMVTRYSATGGDLRSIFSNESQRKEGKVFVVKAGETRDKLYIGTVTGAAIEGKVFLDPEYDGLYQEGDRTLADVQVTLIRTSSGETVESVKTDANGSFCFDALRGADYRLRVTLPNEELVFTQTVDRSVTGNWFAARDSRYSQVNNLELEDMERKTVLVGMVQTGSIAGSVYLDNNYSATRETGEETTSGMKVFLVNEAGQTVAEDRVNADGTYLLEGVTPGTYQIHMECADGYVFTKLGAGNLFTSVNDNGDGVTQPITVAMGQHITGMDAGMVLPGQVKGMIFNDANDNGRQDAQESGLAGVAVTLVNREDDTTTQLITGADGVYSFNRVMPGEYYVHYALPEGGVFAKQASGGNTLTGEGAQAASEIFKFKTAEKKEMALGGALILSAVEGVAFEDLNGSGVMDENEKPMAGLTLQVGETAITTGEDGCFAIEGVRPGEYALALTCPDGYVFSRGALEITPRGEKDFAGVYQASAGKRDVGLQIGLVRPARVNGSVWLDENLSARWEEEEAMVAGLDVILRDLTDGETLFTCTTDTNGAFDFKGLVPGDYEAYLDLPEGCIAPADGDNCFQDNGQGQLVYPAFKLAENQTKDDLVAGIVQYTTIAGMAWLDQGGLVMPLADTKVDLVDETDTVLASFTTGDDGRYAFSQVLPGTYTLKAVLPGDYLMVSNQDDRVTSGEMISVMDTTEGGSGVSHVFRINMGEDENDMDIGAVKPGMLGDTVWLDENGNGLQDTGEKPIKGVRITLMKNGETIAETITDVYGYFLFTDVYPSNYDVLVEWHEELVPTRYRKDIDLLNSELAESEETSQVIRQVSVASNVKNFNFDLGFKLRKEGVYPAEMEPAPTQVWK